MMSKAPGNAYMNSQSLILNSTYCTLAMTPVSHDPIKRDKVVATAMLNKLMSRLSYGNNTATATN
jgi:hypothetical protein